MFILYDAMQKTLNFDDKDFGFRVLIYKILIVSAVEDLAIVPVSEIR